MICVGLNQKSVPIDLVASAQKLGERMESGFGVLS